MTDLTRLRVSLTKHNAHKVATLLRNYATEEVLARLGEVHADEAQARKNLSASTGPDLPEVWDKAQRLGADAIDALVFIGIVFSHHELINAMSNAGNRFGCSGTIERNVHLAGKEYTNFARVIDQLGFSSQRAFEGVTFDLTSVFEVQGLGPLARDLLEMKLNAAGWNQANTVDSEAVALGFNEVFGISPDELSDWLNFGVKPATADRAFLPKDQKFFQQEIEDSAITPFEFRPGHIERDVTPTSRASSAKSKANRLHNDIQNRLYKFLAVKLGASHVGTELDTGTGTAIDVAVRSGRSLTFYEIKTSASVRTSIRQALPQLLEYAHWPQERRADSFVVVSHLPITKAGNQYLEFLRTHYGIPISYQQFDLVTNELL